MNYRRVCEQQRFTYLLCVCYESARSKCLLLGPACGIPQPWQKSCFSRQELKIRKTHSYESVLFKEDLDQVARKKRVGSHLRQLSTRLCQLKHMGNCQSLCCCHGTDDVKTSIPDLPEGVQIVIASLLNNVKDRACLYATCQTMRRLCKYDKEYQNMCVAAINKRSSAARNISPPPYSQLRPSSSSYEANYASDSYSSCMTLMM